jgi:dienelactone hydrolase
LGVLVLTGSSGRVDVERAGLFARHGAISEAIQWFGGPGQSAGPWETPLEIFLDRVTALHRDCDRLAIVGTSFGSEAALLTAAHDHRVDAVVGFAPSDVSWGARDDHGGHRPHWTLGGESVPYVPFIDDWQPQNDPPSFRSLYEQSRAAAPDQVSAATIPTERIPTVILVAGGDDQVWPSELHARLIMERRRAHGRETMVITNGCAGHRTVLPGEEPATGGLRMARGGSTDADRHLGVAAWGAIERVLLTGAGSAGI